MTVITRGRGKEADRGDTAGVVQLACPNNPRCISPINFLALIWRNRLSTKKRSVVADYFRWAQLHPLCSSSWPMAGQGGPPIGSGVCPIDFKHDWPAGFEPGQCVIPSLPLFSCSCACAQICNLAAYMGGFFFSLTEPWGRRPKCPAGAAPLLWGGTPPHLTSVKCVDEPMS